MKRISIILKHRNRNTTYMVAIFKCEEVRRALFSTDKMVKKERKKKKITMGQLYSRYSENLLALLKINS